MPTIWDTLTNLVSGLGGAKDKATYDQFGLVLMDRAQLEAAYRSDWIARKIVDIPPNDETRAGREWQAESDQIEAIETLESKLGFWGKLAKARRMARLYGGGALVLGMRDGMHDQPLDIERVGKGDLAYLLAFSCHELTAGEIERRYDDPNFGNPKEYTVATAENPVRVHYSRVVRFVGAPLPDMNSQSVAQGWGDSIIQACYDAVHNAGLVAQATAALVQEAKLDIIRVPNLTQHLSTTAGTTLIQNRFANANKLKSMINTLLLDKEEEWERKTTSFAHLPELMDRYVQIAAGAADFPVTRLLGQSPQGMNSTGDGDYKNYLDRISAGQEIEIRPAISVLDEVIIRSALGSRPPEVYYKFAPLWHLSEKEKADVFKSKAEAARTLAGSGGTSPALMPIEALSDAIVNELIEDGSLSGLESAIEEYGSLAEQEDDPEEMQAALTPGGNPDAPDPRMAADAAPRTLYVRRDVINRAEIERWAKSQGFTDIVPDLHVTIAYSRTPVDWFAVGQSWSDKLDIAAGGPRQMERLGADGKYVALLITANELVWRHREIVEAGASWDWPEYQPHISIQIGGEIDLSKVEPYQGRIVLGPEIFEEVRED